MNLFNQHFKHVKNWKISDLGSDDELYKIAVTEYEKGKNKSFPFL